MSENSTDVNTGVIDGAQLGLAVGALFILAVAQMSILPILAPLARSTGLAEWQIGVMMSVAALMLVLTGTWWGGRSQAWGSKPVLMTALAVAAISLAAFAVLVSLRFSGVISTGVLIVFMLITRGVLFGGTVAAMMPATQTYVATVTVTETARVKGMAAIGAAQGMAMLVGSALGGGLAAIGLIAPLVVMPIVLAAMALVIAIRL